MVAPATPEPPAEPAAAAPAEAQPSPPTATSNLVITLGTTGKRGLDTAARGFASGAGTCTPAQLQTVHDFPYLRGLGAPPR